MESRYYIRIINTKTGQVSYFDRIKSSYGMRRIITSSISKGKCYPSMESAESEMRAIRSFFSEEYDLCVESVESVTVVIGNSDNIEDYV